MKRIQVLIEAESLDRIAAYCKESGASRSAYLRLRLSLLIGAIETDLRQIPPFILRTIGDRRSVPLEVPQRLYDEAAALVAAGKAPSLAALVRTAAEMMLKPEEHAA